MGWLYSKKKAGSSTAQLPVAQNPVMQDPVVQNPVIQEQGSQNSVSNGHVPVGLSLPSDSTPHVSWPPSAEEHTSTSSSVADLANSFPSGDFRNGTPGKVTGIKCEIMANWLHSKQQEKIWSSHQPGEGVFVKKSKNEYACSPAELVNDGTPLYKAVSILNVRVRRVLNWVAFLAWLIPV